MRIPRIFTSQALVADSSLELEPGPSAHVSRVLRMRVDDALILFNGSGGCYPARIAAIDKKSVRVAITAHIAEELESPLYLHLGIAVSRGDRLDWVVQKATELGVNQITPLLTERTEFKLKPDRIAKKLEHWRQVSVSACEQCGRNTLPELDPLQNLGQWLPTVHAERKLVLHHRDGAIDRTDSRPASIALLIGPEGGLTEQEITAALDQNFDALSLGPRVLRTETAPLAAIAILQAQWGDMPVEI